VQLILRWTCVCELCLVWYCLQSKAQNSSPVVLSNPLLAVPLSSSSSWNIPPQSLYPETVGNVAFPVGRTGNVKLAVGRPTVGKLVIIGRLVRIGGLGPRSHG
jgi:hypothetical protein